MGGGASVDLPEALDLEGFRGLAGDRFCQEVFDEHKSPNGTISKEKVLQLNALTDCFLTHDWGTDELGRSNHERVARVNESLKERGFVTWFDSDRLVGNIVAQMCNGIDNTKSILVFITKNYIDKVSGDNANDNCQLEFNYALRQKSAKHMIPIVMEPRVRDTQTWKGAVGMALGGTLYVDMVDDRNWEAQCDELAKHILHLVRPIRRGVVDQHFGITKALGSTDGTKSALSTPRAKPAASEPTKPLQDLTSVEVVYLLRSLNLSNYMVVFQKKGVDGATLAFVHTEQELVDMGIDLLPKARMFFSKLSDFRSFGVPLDLVSWAAAAGPPQSTSPAAPAATGPAVTASAASAQGSRTAPSSSSSSNPASATDIESQIVGKRSARYSWFRHQSTTYSLTKAVRKIVVRGVSGALEKKLNGDYAIYEDDSEENLHPVYRKILDPDLWLEYLKEKKCWQMKSTASRGGRSCLAEQPCAPTRSLFVCDRPWMVHDGKGAFAEQSAVRVLPFVEDVVVFGARGKIGAKINGKYAPSHEVQCDHPLFIKRGDADVCIEFNTARSRWQIKTAAARGSNGCIAEVGEPVTHTSYTPADALSVWAICEDHQFSPNPELHVISEMRAVRLRGGFGKVCTMLSGVYVPQYELQAGQMVYLHQDHADLMLEFSQGRHRWQIKPVASKGTLSCLAELAPAAPQPGEASTPVVALPASHIEPFDGTWSVSEQHALQAYPDMYLVPVFEPLFVSFSAPVSLGESFDDFLLHCSGVFVPLDRPFQDFPVYKHRSPTHLHFLRFDTDSCCWRLHSSTQLSPKKKGRDNSGLGDHVGVFEHHGSRVGDALEECQGVWRILNEELLDSNGATRGQVEVRVLSRPVGVHILDAQGTRAALLNGQYDVTDEVHDHMVVYKKRSMNAALQEGEASDIWIEYSAEMRSWQLKRTADRGSPKAYASLPALAPQFVQHNSLDAHWTVFDVDRHQWVTQQQLRCLPRVLSVVVWGATGGHGDHINGQYDPTDQTFHDLPLYKKAAASGGTQADADVFLEYNHSLRSWQIKADKDRGQNKAWAYLPSPAALRPEECCGLWEVFDTELKWHVQPLVRHCAIHP